MPTLRLLAAHGPRGSVARLPGLSKEVCTRRIFIEISRLQDLDIPRSAGVPSSLAAEQRSSIKDPRTRCGAVRLRIDPKRVDGRNTIAPPRGDAASRQDLLIGGGLSARPPGHPGESGNLPFGEGRN